MLDIPQIEATLVHLRVAQKSAAGCVHKYLDALRDAQTEAKSVLESARLKAQDLTDTATVRYHEALDTNRRLVEVVAHFERVVKLLQRERKKRGLT